MPPARSAPVRPIEAIWREFAMQTLPAEASETQRIETRRAFYAGAKTLLAVLRQSLSEEDDPTAQDMHIMHDIVEDLERFTRDLARGLA